MEQYNSLFVDLFNHHGMTDMGRSIFFFFFLMRYPCARLGKISKDPFGQYLIFPDQCVAKTAYFDFLKEKKLLNRSFEARLIHEK